MVVRKRRLVEIPRKRPGSIKRKCRKSKKKTCYVGHDPGYSLMRKAGIKPINLKR